ncbi:MAG: helix-turn-helix domain-containing protein [Anaerolineae bacterium]
MIETTLPRERLLTVEQVAEILQVHPQTVYGLLRAGHIRAAKVGRAWRVRPQAIDEYLEEQMQANGGTGRI